MTKWQGCEFAHSLITHSLICSFAHSLICSFCSNQMSNCERFAQIAQDKWATVSESLRSLRGNEQPWANRSGCSRQMSDHERVNQVAQRKWANERFPKKNEWFIHLLNFGERPERFAHDRSFPLSDLSESLIWFEQNEWFTHIAHQKRGNEQFAQKMLAKKI